MNTIAFNSSLCTHYMYASTNTMLDMDAKR